jgi:hypothetical protein
MATIDTGTPHVLHLRDSVRNFVTDTLSPALGYLSDTCCICYEYDWIDDWIDWSL